MKPFFLLLCTLTLSAQRNFDVVVYGGTAAGFTTAVSAARHGQKTVLLEPHNHIGGMATGGLSRTDVGRREVIGGMALEFYYRVGQRYEMGRYNNPVAWFYEPKVGEDVMRTMLKEAGVEVLFNQRLKEKDGVKKEGAKVTEITMTNGSRFAGKVFADCSYEGDLMAQAKVSYTYGRESSAQYGETLAGVRDRTPKHQFEVELSPRGADGKLLPEISDKPVPPPGTADKGIQAYNFRIIATNVAANRLPWPKPAGYDAKRYELLAKFLEADTKRRGRAPVFHEMTLIAPIPNGKADFNNNGPFSTDYIGKNYGYPEGNYAERDRIWEDHVRYVQGYYYFLANDPRVPKSLQQEVNTWGLPKDEYLDTRHWPHQLYVREARRMVGEYVMIQKDLQTDLSKPDVIGMGSYNSDSHNIQRIINTKGFVENEGDMQVGVKPYQIPYRMLTPKRDEVTNLLVPVCFSASHVAYSSLRMEPQYMILGHAAGLAASIAIQNAQAVQKIDVAALQATLKKEAGVFQFVENDQIKAIGAIRELLRPKGVQTFNWE
ncbi:FAD-dependent oxidoreductase [Bryobacter aggregatus]|uniref:FAD-dependent oxidoreductase n=1 Tax=Bryobacter aggregatus TaxID=360054 RepID=UPI0012BAF4B6|nr:FAD-dependent oxidoreductase [Bryobacter aggregatus]